MGPPIGVSEMCNASHCVAPLRNSAESHKAVHGPDRNVEKESSKLGGRGRLLLILLPESGLARRAAAALTPPPSPTHRPSTLPV